MARITNAGLATVLLASLAVAAAPTTGPATFAGESHQFENVARPDLLRVQDANSRDGTPITLYPHADWKCMTWKLEPAGDAVRLVNYFTHKTFYPDAADDNSPVVQHKATATPADAERWRVVPAGDGVVRLEHVSTGKVLTAGPDGRCVIAPWTAAATQQWKLLDKPARFTG